MPEVSFENLMGWAGVRHADKAWQEISAEFPNFKTVGLVAGAGQGKTVRAWDVWRKVLGRDFNRVQQETGDCVAASANDVSMATQCTDIFRGDRESFEPLLISFQYADSRVRIGKNQLRGGAGSVGSWMAKALTSGGLLRCSLPGVPRYSGKLSDRWGDDKDYNGLTWRQFQDEADDHVIEKGIRVTTYEQLQDAMSQYEWGTIASNCGYEMKPDSKGFHRPSGSWSHQMSLLAISDDWVGMGNQWGDVHGRLIDFETNQPWPPGMLRVTRQDFMRKHFTRNAEVFVFSGIRGFGGGSPIDEDGLLI